MKTHEAAHVRLKERELCLVCGRRPDSFYVRVDSRVKRNCVLCGLFDVDVEQILKDHPDAAGIVCLNCLGAYR